MDVYKITTKKGRKLNIGDFLQLQRADAVRIADSIYFVNEKGVKAYPEESFFEKLEMKNIKNMTVTVLEKTSEENCYKVLLRDAL